MIRTTLARFTARAAILGALAASFGPASAQPAGQLYFTDLFNPDFSTGHINRVNADGSGYAMQRSVGFRTMKMVCRLCRGRGRL